MNITEIVIIITSIILFFFHHKLSNFLNIFDNPDGKRKTHKLPTPLSGGPIIFIVFFLLFISSELKFLTSFNTVNLVQKEIIFLIIGSIFFFMLGLLDDKINLNANIKFFLFTLALLIIFTCDKNLTVNRINFSFTNKTFFLDNFSLAWTILCFLLFINAINMFDGINLQTGSFILLSLIYLLIFTNLFENLIIILIISILGFLILNYNSKLFLGNSGTYFFGFFLGAWFVLSYNIEKSFYVDEIVLIMLIPGLDLMRLFFTRISKKKHPFSADRNHLHHLLSDKYNDKKAYIIILMLIWAPVLIAKFFEIYFIMILGNIIFYTMLIYKLKYFKNN